MVNNVTAAVTGVVINCINIYQVSGNVSGISEPLTLLNNDTPAGTVDADGTNITFFTVLQGSNLNLTVTDPADKRCTVTGGVVDNVMADVTDIDIVCVNTFNIGGTITGLNGTITDPLVITNNGVTYNLTAETTYSFVVDEGVVYNVTIDSSPASQICEFSPTAVPGGTANAGDSNIDIICRDKTLLTDISYRECLPLEEIDGVDPLDSRYGKLPNQDNTTLCNTGAFKACVERETSANSWKYMEDVDYLDCTSAGIDDPRDVFQFVNLTGIELNGSPTKVGSPSTDYRDYNYNPLNQMTKDFFTKLSNKFESVDVYPNDRFPILNITVTVEGLPHLAALEDALKAGIDLTHKGYGSISENVNELSTNDGTTWKLEVQALMWGYDVWMYLPDTIGGYVCSVGGLNPYQIGRVVDYVPVEVPEGSGNFVGPYDYTIGCYEGASVGGTVIGLPTDAELQISTSNLEYTDRVSVTSDGAFTINTRNELGFSYSYNVTTDDSGCKVYNGSGFSSAHVTDVTVNCISGNGYSSVTPMPTPRLYTESTVLNGKIYVSGGRVDFDTPTDIVEVFDPITESWSTTEPMPDSFYGGHSSVALDGKLYVIGDSNLMYVYDPDTNTWGAPITMPNYKGGSDSVVVDGKIYIIDAGSSIVDVYDPTSGWSTAASLPSTLDGSAAKAAVTIDGKIYVIDGSSMGIYDPLTNSWSDGPSLWNYRTYFSSAVINGKIYVVGGQTGPYGNDVEVYDPTTNIWDQRYGHFPVNSIESHSSSVVDGKMYIFGGGLAFYDSSGFFVSSIDVSDIVITYDPVKEVADTGSNPYIPSNIYSNAPNIVIPDSAATPLVTTINVAGTNRNIVSPLLTVDVDIDHSAQGDLTIDLTSPDGTTVRLWNQTGGTTQNIRGNFPGTLTPENALTAFDGESLDGPWTLTVTDADTQGTGSLVSWGIRINPYSETTGLNTSRYRHSSTVLNGKIYVLGGLDDVGPAPILDSVEVSTPTVDGWTTLATPMPVAKFDHSSVGFNDKIIVTGGQGYKSVEVFDATAGTWSTTAIPALPEERSSHSSVVVDGKIYVIGGFTGLSSTVSPSVLVFDTANPGAGWVASASLNTPRYGHSSVVFNGKIYVIGGYDGITYFNSVEVFDPANPGAGWVPGPSLNFARYSHSSVVLNGYIYTTGGTTLTKLSSVEVYDPNLGIWVQNGEIPYSGISSHTAEALNGKYYLIGGYVDSSQQDIVKVYDSLVDSTFSTSIYASEPNFTIPDNGAGVLDAAINIAGSGKTVNSYLLKIDVDVQHGAAEELTVNLISPLGKSVNLWSPGGAAVTNIQGTFPTTLSVSGDLSILNGDALDGTWHLQITDGGTAGTGSLVRWAIRN